MLYGHGDNAYQFNHDITADFSTNVYYQGTSPQLINYLQERINDIGRYPEVNAESLTKKIAQHNRLDEQNILVVNGATEAFYLIALLFQGQHSEIFVPSFAEYEDACRLYKHQIQLTNNSMLDEHYRSQASVVWLCNPNNPDGKLMSRSTLSALIENHQKTTFIIDEA